MILALCGYKASGKSTLARLLEDDGWVRAPIAGPLKNMLRALGLSDEQLNGHLKEVPCDLLGGQTPRRAMQALGSEWGRKCFGGDFWVKILASQVGNVPWDVVVDDLRFPNEELVLRELGAMVVRIDRPGIEQSSDHDSEASLAQLRPDHVIVNSGTPEDLVAHILVLVEAHDTQVAP